MAKALADIRSLARAHTETCIRALASIVVKSENDNARVAAINSLLDRGWGKAAQTHTDGDGGPIQIVLRQVIDVVEHSKPVVIDITPDRDS
jgi:hypothetical protein